MAKAMRLERSKKGFERAPIGNVRDGDVISIDLDARTLNLDLPEDEFEKRMAAFEPSANKIKSRWLRRCAKLVSSASTGAVFLD